MAQQRKKRETFGKLRKLPSGRYQANYTGPDTRLHKAPSTFDTREDRDTMLNSGMESGAEQSYAALDTHLATLT